MAQADAGEYWILNASSGDPFTNSINWNSWNYKINRVTPSTESRQVKVSGGSIQNWSFTYIAKHDWTINYPSLESYKADAAGSRVDLWLQVMFDSKITNSNNGQFIRCRVVTYSRDGTYLYASGINGINGVNYRTYQEGATTSSNSLGSYWLMNHITAPGQTGYYTTYLLVDSSSSVEHNIDSQIYVCGGFGYTVPTETIITAKNANIYGFMLRRLYSGGVVIGDKITKTLYTNNSFSLNDNTFIKASDRDRLINYLKDGTTRYL